MCNKYFWVGALKSRRAKIIFFFWIRVLTSFQYFVFVFANSWSQLFVTILYLTIRQIFTISTSLILSTHMYLEWPSQPVCNSEGRTDVILMSNFVSHKILISNCLQISKTTLWCHKTNETKCPVQNVSPDPRVPRTAQCRCHHLSHSCLFVEGCYLCLPVACHLKCRN